MATEQEVLQAEIVTVQTYKNEIAELEKRLSEKDSAILDERKRNAELEKKIIEKDSEIRMLKAKLEVKEREIEVSQIRHNAVHSARFTSSDLEGL